MKELIKKVVVVAVLSSAAVGCSSGDGDSSSSPAVAVAEVDTSGLEAAVQELNDKLDQLAQNFVVNDDGSSGFVQGTAPAIITESKFGFAFPLPEGIEPTYVGINDAEADSDSGSLLASAGGVSVLLLWVKPETPLTPGNSVTSSFEVLQANTDADFSLLGAGQDAFTVDEQEAAYATFAATDDNQQTIGVAVIGGWTCESDGRAYALTVSGRSKSR